MKLILNKRLLPTLLVFLSIAISLYAGGGKRGKDKGPEANNCTVEEVQGTVGIGFSTPHLVSPSSRMSTFSFNPPEEPNLWTGAPSAQSLSDINNYFCVVTVQSDCGDPDNPNYTYEREYVWNYGNITSSLFEMELPLPSNSNYTISVEYWEQCGPYWAPNYNDKRGVWVATQSHFQGVTNVYFYNTDFYFLKANNC